MDYGLFTMPTHPPERSLYDGHQWDLQQLRWADELGFSEAWIGEHHTVPWEPHPSPRPARGPGLVADDTHAHRPRWLPHAIPPPGRAGQSGGDARPSRPGAPQLRRGGRRSAQRLGHVQRGRNVGQHREMTREALDLILRLWSDEADYSENPKAWRHSMELLAREVMPRFKDLLPK